jgi:hypothetical protein
MIKEDRQYVKEGDLLQQDGRTPEEGLWEVVDRAETVVTCSNRRPEGSGPRSEELFGEPFEGVI